MAARGSIRWTALLALAAACAASSPAFAQSEADRAAARELAEKAQDRIEAGDHEEALRLLREADETFHAPSIALLIGRTLVKLGRVAEAADQLDEVQSERLAGDAPEAWRNAVRLAGEERAALDARLGTLVLEITPASADPRVRLGARTSRPARGAHRVDGGASTEIRVEAPGYRLATRSVTVSAGARTELSIALVPIGHDAAPPPSPEDEASPPSSSFLATPWPTVIGGSVTAVTLGIGAVLGLSALGEASDLESRCGDASCSDASPAERQELRAIQESGRGSADASTALFVVSGVAAAATTVFAVLWMTSSDEPASAGAAQLRGGPGWASVNGSF